MLDNPKKPEFSSWRSYHVFSKRVRHHRRYVWGPEIEAFLDTVLATIGGRDVVIAKDSILYRAQLGVDWRDTKVGEEVHGYGPKRMKPLVGRAKEGRVNPLGIPVLYLANTVETAISEVRPWVGSEVSVAQFRAGRDLRAINLSLGHGKVPIGHLTFSELFGETKPDAAKKLQAVWIDIDSAFSEPVTATDDSANYVSTQILAELFREAGYEAIIYRSQFGKRGFNIALFNVADAEPINCTPYRVTGVQVSFAEFGNTWFAKKRQKRKK